MKTNRTHSIVVLIVLVIILSASQKLSAATRVKADNADALNLASSWTNVIVPGGADLAQFDATITGPLTLGLGADTAWSQINFLNPAGNVTLSAGSTLTLSNNNPILFGTGAADLALNCDVKFAGSGFTTIRSPVGQTLALNGALDGRDIAVTLGNSAGTILLGSPNTVRIGSVVQVSTAGLRLGLGASSVGEPISSGPLGTNLFTWAASAATTELFAYNGNQTLGNPVRVQLSPWNFNSTNDLTFTGVVDLNNGNRVINITSNGVLRFTGIISNATGLTKTGSGVLELGGTNVSVWNAGLSIFGGTVRLGNDNVIPDGGSVNYIAATNTDAVLDMNGHSDTIRGLARSGGNGYWGGTVDNTAPGTTSVLTLGDNFTYGLDGAIQNSGLNAKLALVKIGTGGLILTNTHTFSGGITNASDSEIFINSPGAAGAGPITLASLRSELVYSGSGTGVWTNDIILAAGTAPVFSVIDGSVLQIASVIKGPGLLNRTNTLFQQGLLNLSGDNTFTGGFSLFGGAVMFSHPRAAGLGPLLIGNATFTGGTIYLVPGVNLSGANAITNTVLINRDFTVGGTNAVEFAGPVLWGTNSFPRSINVTNLSSVQITGPMTGYGFNKVGQGVLTLNSVCSHNGPSTISVGPLALGPGGEFTGVTTILVGGSAWLDVSAVANFAVKPNQALRVDDGSKVKGNVIINGALTNTAFFGSVTFSNNLTFAAGSTNEFTIYRFALTRTNLVCLGNLAYGGNLIVNNFGDPLEAGDAFKLFDFTGSPGSFDELTLPALDSGLAWDTSSLAVDGTIKVIATASPAPQLTDARILDGTNFILTVTGGVTNGEFRVLTQTNVAEPMVNWLPWSTNTYDGAGALTVTNPVNPLEPQRFFRVSQP